MSYLRWAFTALAFPIAGWLAVQVAGESVGPRTALVWAIGVALSWTIGWVVSALVITTGASGFVIFGISGAVVVTILTGLLLRRIVGSRTAPEAPPAAARTLARTGAVR